MKKYVNLIMLLLVVGFFIGNINAVTYRGLKVISGLLPGAENRVADRQIVFVAGDSLYDNIDTLRTFALTKPLPYNSKLKEIHLKVRNNGQQDSTGKPNGYLRLYAVKDGKSYNGYPRQASLTGALYLDSVQVDTGYNVSIDVLSIPKDTAWIPAGAQVVAKFAWIRNYSTDSLAKDGTLSTTHHIVPVCSSYYDTSGLGRKRLPVGWYGAPDSISGSLIIQVIN